VSNHLFPTPDCLPSRSLIRRALCHFLLLIFAAALACGAQSAHEQNPAAGQENSTPEITGSAPEADSPVEAVFQEPQFAEPNDQVFTNAGPINETSSQESLHEKHPPESELIAEGEGSFGHYHIFAYSWWSELYTGGIEYDRHTWNYFLKSQMDYVAEILPVAILRQPADTDVFGDPLSQSRVINPGLGIYPVGLRMKWRYDKGWQPYFIIKGGMLFFAQKALSKDAAHQNFSLQMGLGMQRRLTRRFDVRLGYEDIHFSDAFMVPSNPGLDVMSYDGGIVYRLGK